MFRAAEANPFLLSCRTESDLRTSDRGKMNVPSDKVIYCVGPCDVLMGRGKLIQSHAGNVEYRRIIKAHYTKYKSSTKERDSIAEEIIRCIHSQGGRFLRDMSSTKGSYTYAVASSAWTECAASMVRTKVKQALRDMAKKAPKRPPDSSRHRQSPRLEEASHCGSSQPIETKVQPSSFRECESLSGTPLQSACAASPQSHQNISKDAEDADERRMNSDLTPRCDAGDVGRSANQAKSDPLLFPIVSLPPTHRTDLRIDSSSRTTANMNLYTVVRDHQRPRPRSPVCLTRSEILRRYWIQEQRRESWSSCGLTDGEITELLMDLQEEQKSFG